MGLNEKEQAAFDKLAACMDAREVSFVEIKKYEDEHGFVPAIPQTNDARFMASYRDYKLTGGWRKEPAVVKSVEASARLMVKNQQKAFNNLRRNHRN